MSSVANLPLIVSRFPTAKPAAEEALGDMEQKTWGDLRQMLSSRREGQKDGPNLVFARFRPEKIKPTSGQPQRQIVRRLKVNLEARTAVALDVDGNKDTGEVAPALGDISRRIIAQGWAALIYTSHSHSAAAPRYRIVLPLNAEIPHHLPAVEAVAEILGLSGVLDKSKLGASSVFYLPSSEPGKQADHHSGEIEGSAIDAAWIVERADAVLAERDRVQAEIRAGAMAESERRRAAKLAAGFKPTDKLIDGIRDRLDLTGELLKHGYEKRNDRFLYPGSESGIPGVHILRGSDGIERAYSHHSGDPLAASNLPSWCTVKAVDAVDVAAILDFGGDFTKALHELGKRFGIETDPGRKARQAPPEPPPGFDDVPPPDDRPSDGIGRDRFDQTFNRTEEKRQSGQRTEDGRIWPAPVDFLTNEAMGAPILAANHVPAAIWPFVIDTAERMGVDPSAVALACIVSCASVVTDDWAICPRQHDHTWTENARLWGAIVGNPSIMKSPIVAAATKPIDKLEVDARNRHKEEMRAWRVEENEAKQAKTRPPPAPKLDRYMVEGTTIEALGEILRDDDEAKMRTPAKKVLSRHDEMSEFFGNLDRYKAGGKGGGDRGAYLRLYNGGRYTIDRIGRGPFGVPNWSACFLGGIQPGPIQRIAKEAAEDGLLQRFIYCVPERQGQGIDRQPDNRALDRYARLFPALAGLTPTPAMDGGEIKPVVLHADAHGERQEIASMIVGLSSMPDTSPRLQSAFGKWHGLFARLALTFHLIEIADHRARGEAGPYPGVVSGRTAKMAAAFLRDIALPHLLRADALMFATDQGNHAEWIAGFILSRRLEIIQVRDVVQAYRPLRPPETRRELDGVMRALVAMAWLDPDEPSNPAKGVTSWHVNPAVHVAFAARAAAEAERRAKQRETIAEHVAKVRAARKA